MHVGSLFSGIGGFDLAFQRAGFQIAWQCESDPFCQRILHQRFGVPIAPDICTMGAPESVAVLVGGFPCQDLSVAGQRKGLHGERSSLFFEFIRVLRALRPRWMVIENVPGFLSSHRGLDFALAIRELDQCGYVGSWRVLDSQYFGLAQRRKRVFLVASPREYGDGAQTVLFEPESGTRNSPASEEAGADLAYCLAASVRDTGDGHGQGWNSNYVASTLRGRSHGASSNEPGRGGEDDVNLVAYTLGTNERNKSQGPANYVPVMATCLNPGHEAKHTYAGDGGTLNLVCGVHANQRRELRISPLAGSLNGSLSGKQYEGVFQDSQYGVKQYPQAGSLRAGRIPEHQMVLQGDRARALVTSMYKRHDDDTDTLIASPITASAGHHGHSSPRGDGSDTLITHPTLQTKAGRLQIEEAAGYQPTVHGVRRLTPLECERLQGFPDGWTCLCGEGHRGSEHCRCSDTPRYKALGNAVSVPVARWIASRIMSAT